MIDSPQLGQNPFTSGGVVRAMAASVTTFVAQRISFPHSGQSILGLRMRHYFTRSGECKSHLSPATTAIGKHLDLA